MACETNQRQVALEVFVIYPTLAPVFNSDQTRRRIETLLNRIEQNTEKYNLSDVKITNLSSKRIQDPKVFYRRVRDSSAKVKFIFYLGSCVISNSNIYLTATQTRVVHKRSYLELSNLRGVQDLYIFCDLHQELMSVGSLDNVCERIYVKEFSLDSHTYFDEFIALNQIVPKYSLLRALKYIPRSDRTCRYLTSTGKNKNSSISSIYMRHIVWDQDSEHFSSSSAGTREDGLQALRFLLNDKKTTKESLQLLEYFQFTDESESVRTAAKNILVGGRRASLRVPMIVKSHVGQLKGLVGELMKVPAGEFFMGSDDERMPAYSHLEWAPGLAPAGSLPEERPKHLVYLETYKIQRAPVSHALFKKYHVETNRDKALPKCITTERKTPITHVSWYDAIEFCIWLNVRMRDEGLLDDDEEFRIPTEAEWEKAASGPQNYRYPWGDKFKPNCCHYYDSDYSSVIESGAFSPSGDSPYGVQDMAGNSWDWTLSNWGEGGSKPDFEYPYRPMDGREDIFASSRVRRVIRGGGWYYYWYCLRTTTRNIMYPETVHSGGGFRLVRSTNKFLDGLK